MYNVFSKYLEPLKQAHIVVLTEQSKPSEVFNSLRKAYYYYGIKGIEDCIRLFVSNPEEEDELAEYIYFNEDLMKVVRWANRNITANITKITYTTLGVQLRIICSMLIKLKDSGKLKESVYFTIHSNLTKNVLKVYEEVTLEDLPF